MLKMDWDSQRSNKEDHEPLNKRLSQYLSHTCNFTNQLLQSANTHNFHQTLTAHQNDTQVKALTH